MILPNEVLYIILDLLRDEKDYNTLYQCATSSRFFTEQALILLYQLYDTAPVTGGGSTEDEPIKAQRTGGSLINAKRKQEKTLWKWATMWRSVILSAFDKTYLPYCNYIRYLNLSDLSELLAHSGFKGRTRDHFFTPELYNFVREGYHEPMSNPRHKNYPDSDWMMVKFGSLVTSKTTSIRGLTGHVSSQLISEWLSRLPLLQTLSVWFGESLTNTGEKIHEHCPEFKRLTVYRWMNWDLESTDSDVEKFLNDLRPHTLEHFEILSYSMLGPRSIRAINSHLNSLTELKLTSLNGDAIAALPSLTAPPKLRALTLTDSKSLPLDDEYDSMVTRVGEWIHGCKSLRQLNLRKFVNDAILLSHALGEDGPRLTTLGLAGYSATRARSFHEALALQGSLQELSLSGECIEYPEDIEILVQAITQLNDLRVLELLEVSDGFTPDHIIALMPFLPRLEQLAIGGDHFDDSIWNTFLCLPKLKYLFLNALSDFTVRGILSFIAQLGPDNRGFNLSIMNSTNEAKLTDEEQELIRNTIENSLGGAFDFGLAQDEYSDIDSDEFSDYGPP